MSNEIDTGITPALHPAVVSKIPGYESDEAVRQVVAPTETAFSSAYNAVQSVWTARALIEKDTSKTEDARLLQLDTFAGKQLAAVGKTFDATLANLNRSIAFLEGELSMPLISKAGTAMGAEIRAHVKGMTTAQRQEFIQTAIDSGDEETAAAVLGAKHYLTGITAQMQQALTRGWNSKMQPDKAKRLTAMQGAKGLIEEHAGKVFVELEKAVGGSSKKAKAIREAQAAADKAVAG